MPDKKHAVIALIPAYNEAARIALVIEGARQHLPVWVVDDGSRDETAKIAARAGADVISYQPNQGKGAALRTGFKKALDLGASSVLTLDADGQHDPEEIPKFLEVYRARKPALIIGARDFSKMPFIRRMANTIGGRLISLAAGQEICDNQSGYRLIRLDLMHAMLESSEAGFEFEVEMVIKCIQNKWPLDWVPIRTIYRDQGSHIHPLKHTINFFRMVRRIRREKNNPHFLV